ncbi:hypothetical protein [Paenibacillus sp. DYY-L-2]|uniref:hypothetical protein n=1 Tax=Paenibacillus sp. DYY-L-2 TaxID=3447013 RepID=UPI003F4FDACF
MERNDKKGVQSALTFIIQDMATGTYLKHNGSGSIEHLFRDVELPEQAEQYSNYDHACYAAFWYADMSRNWRVIDTVTNRTFVHDSGGRFKLERDQDDENEDEDIPATHKFRWKDRVGCVEAIASECADNGGKYDAALRSVRLSEFAFNATRMPVKQKTQLKRDVIKRAKDIQHMREAADVGDIVRVPKLIENPLLGGASKRDGRKLVEAVIVGKVKLATSFRYTVQRLEDGQTQTGNGHMIKSIIRRGARAQGS